MVAHLDAAQGSSVSGSGTTIATSCARRLLPYTNTCATGRGRFCEGCEGLQTDAPFILCAPCRCRTRHSSNGVSSAADHLSCAGRARSHLGHKRRAAVHVLDLLRRDVLALRQLEERLLAVDDLQAAAGQPHAHVACARHMLSKAWCQELNASMHGLHCGGRSGNWWP